MPNVIIPVGFSMGPDYDITDPPATEPEYYEIQAGSSRFEADADDAKAWAVAHFDGDRHAKLAVTRQTLERDLRANKGGITDPAPIVDELLKAGLLLEFDPVNDPLEPLFRRYRLYPTGTGFGNSQQKPAEYRVGIGTTPLVVLTETLYTLWGYAFREKSLWHACGEAAAGFAESDQDLRPGEKPLNLTAEQVAREIAVVLPMLIATECAFLDPVD